jgi:hypothetical protein
MIYKTKFAVVLRAIYNIQVQRNHNAEFLKIKPGGT